MVQEGETRNSGNKATHTHTHTHMFGPQTLPVEPQEAGMTRIHRNAPVLHMCCELDQTVRLSHSYTLKSAEASFTGHYLHRARQEVELWHIVRCRKCSLSHSWLYLRPYVAHGWFISSQHSQFPTLTQNMGMLQEIFKFQPWIKSWICMQLLKVLKFWIFLVVLSTNIFNLLIIVQHFYLSSRNVG